MEEVLPTVGGARPRGRLGVAGGGREAGVSLARCGRTPAEFACAAISTQPAPRGRRPSPARCGACPRGRRGQQSSPMQPARCGRSAPPHAGGAPARRLDATSRARPHGRLSAPCTSAELAGGARPRCWLGAPPHAATD
ncbi:hypothetical protein PAHAL_9G193800 [Panicum hallii]|uniref:Uncharacterized protein n=1 Tax=Panicum hallii TaxID=206008 RepID=A0A2S3IKX7_9POAL|nr:hypothetical protein PAHAL_9G193800 [Panicum hallii]